MLNKVEPKLLFGTVLVILCIFARFIPVAPNFTPILAIALFSGAIFSNKRIALLIPIIAMFISDLVIGLHSTMFAVYLSCTIIAILGIKMKKINLKNVLINSLAGAIIFFIITNFAVWVAGWYGYTFEGLINCYIAAIPFFRYTLVSIIAYGIILFGTYYFAEKYILSPSISKQ